MRRVIERATNREYIAKYVESRRSAAEARPGGATIQLLRLHSGAGSMDVIPPAPVLTSGNSSLTSNAPGSPLFPPNAASRSHTLLTQRSGSRGPDPNAIATGIGALATTGYGYSSLSANSYGYGGRFSSRNYTKASSVDPRRRASAAAPEEFFEHEQLLQEVAAMRALDHLNIVRLVDAFEASERVVLVMEMCVKIQLIKSVLYFEVIL